MYNFPLSVNKYTINLSIFAQSMKWNNNNIGFRRLLFVLFMNKYTLTALIFLVWLTFFDQNNLIEKMQLNHKITVLQKEKAYYENKIKEDNRKIQELLGNKENLEKFAREQYLMKKPNEDIFVIVNE